MPITGLESFDIPWKPSSSGNSGSIGANSKGSEAMGAQEYEEPEESSGGGMGNEDFAQKFMLALQMKKTMADYKSQVKQARFFLPRTLQSIAGQYGTQGSYYSSGRVGAQQEAAKKTQFDLQQAKRDAQFAYLGAQMEMAELNRNSQSQRSA